jgi:hypothetical protein
MFKNIIILIIYHLVYVTSEIVPLTELKELSFSTSKHVKNHLHNPIGKYFVNGIPTLSCAEIDGLFGSDCQNITEVNCHPTIGFQWECIANSDILSYIVLSSIFCETIKKNDIDYVYVDSCFLWYTTYVLKVYNKNHNFYTILIDISDSDDEDITRNPISNQPIE